ncbi:hypothetical protein [Labrenzia sp. PHM005]|uniref:hypothetical protein n=1 Tax=Labrenzia sp. PHM005 TaxID=2590016 RepID=UPI00143CDED9|nr:hypothetical protein [Labrenzia sp. PHM005]
MLNIYAQSFMEASRFSSNTRPDPHTHAALEKMTERKSFAPFFWAKRTQKR